MDWYYEQSGSQSGPTTEANLKELRRSGAIPGTTLIWNEDMIDWAPMDQVVPPGSYALQEVETCSSCGQAFDKGDLLQLRGLFVCATCKPLALQRTLEGMPLIDSGKMSWASGKLLITQAESELPTGCVKCGEPSTTRVKRTLYWHSPFYYLLILASPLIYIIVALIARKSGKLQVPLCEMHRLSCKRAPIIGVLLILLGVGCLIAGSTYELPNLIIGFPVLMLTGLIFWVVKSRTLVPKKIDDSYMHLKGACAKYLEPLPPFPE